MADPLTWFVAYKVAKVVVGAALVMGGATVVLPAAGFTAAGVAAGSVAAGVQGLIGNVAAGSVFAAAQSAGVVGLAATTKTALAAGGAALALLF